jgi:hypothetical protein
MEENSWQTCLQNPLNVFNLKHCAVKLELPPGSNEVACAMFTVWQCFGGSDEVKTLHTWRMSCALCARMYLAVLCSIDAAAFVLECIFFLAPYWNHFTSTIFGNLIHNRSLKSIMFQKSLRTIFSYGIIFWGSLLYSNSIFKIRKKIIRFIVTAEYRDSCRPLFKKLNIFPPYSQYIFSLSTIVVKNIDAFKFNSAIYSINTLLILDLHLPTTNLTKAQKRSILPWN